MSIALEKLKSDLKILETLSLEDRVKYIEDLENDIDPMWEDIFEMGRVLNSSEDVPLWTKIK